MRKMTLKQYWPMPAKIFHNEFESFVCWGTLLSISSYGVGAVIGASTVLSKTHLSHRVVVPSILILWWHNEQSVILMIVAGFVTAGIATVLILLYNGFLLGWAFSQVIHRWTILQALVVLVPHAIFELTALFLGAQLSFIGILSFVKYRTLKPLRQKSFLYWTAYNLVLISVLLIIAAVFEVTIQ